MKATDCIVKFLETQNIEYVFGYQGGMITHLVDSLSRSLKTKYIQCYHEQSASFCAEGYALESGKIGVAISTSGPGATNMITGIADAYFSSIPVLYITGQVNTYEYKYDKKIRQQGFQETDIVSVVKPITKYAAMVNRVEDLECELKKAVTIALMGRKGPVLLDLPMNIQRSDIPKFDYLLTIKENYPIAETESLKMAHKLMSEAKRPLVICGNGIFQSNNKNLVQKFLDETGCPYVVSMLGKSCADETSKNFLGVIGSYGNRCANIIFSQSDVVLALGSRLDLRQTGNVNSEVLKNIKFIHVDIDECELNDSKIDRKLNIHASIQDFISRIDTSQILVSGEWQSYCQKIKELYSQKNEINRFCNEESKKPYVAIEKIRQAEKDSDTVFVADIGQNQMWAMQHLALKFRENFFTSGGLAPMGFAVPCAIGAAFAHPDKKIVCITGDGGFHFALQSLMLISQYNLNISIYVLNNSSLGMITQFQSLYFCGRMAGTTKSGGYYVPDISKIAEAYNLKYKCISDILNQGLCCDTNQICEIKLGELTVVVPKLEYNNELFDMTPHLSGDELSDVCKFTPPPHCCKSIYYNSLYSYNSAGALRIRSGFCKEAA